MCAVRHFINLRKDVSVSELARIFELGMQIKSELKKGKRVHYLEGKVLALIFEKMSLRTRVSFETGMIQMGGGSVYLDDSHIGFGKRESVPDISHVLSSMVDGIVFRAREHQSVEALAKYATCPVINALTDQSHPCQALADMLTVHEEFGSLKGKKIAWVGDANNVAASLIEAASMLGCSVSVAAPEGYQFSADNVHSLIGDAPVDGFGIELTSSPEAAVKNAYAVFTDVWVSMGQEAETEARKKVFAPYQVNGNLMSKARPDAIFMHCLPARRGLEVTDEVMDSSQSRIIQEAENRLHAQKGMLVWLLNESMR